MAHHHPLPITLNKAITRDHSVFNEVPNDILEEMFKPNLIFRSWSPSLPALVLALEGQPGLQQEALRIMFKYSAFKLDGFSASNWWASDTVMLIGIRHLWVDVDKTPCTPNYLPTREWLQTFLARCPSLEDVTIHCASHSNSDHVLVSNFIRKFPSWLSTLRATEKITVILPYCKLLSRSGSTLLSHDYRDRHVAINVEEMDARLGVKGRLTRSLRWGIPKGCREDSDWFAWDRKVLEGEIGEALDCKAKGGEKKTWMEIAMDV